MDRSDRSVQAEFQRRMDLWHVLLAAGGNTGVRPPLLNELRIYRGQAGIWFDKGVTAPATPGRTGATVGLLHTGRRYAHDLGADGVVFHYPETMRKGLDEAEVEATKAAHRLGLPVFVIVGDGPYDVHLSWVEKCCDAAKIFLVTFGDRPPRASEQTVGANATFNLQENRRKAQMNASARTGQSRFRFEVFSRYGLRCAVCNMTVKDVLDAAHLCPHESGGTDDPRNGLVLCVTHHRALDAGLFAIEPQTLQLRFHEDGPDRHELRITRADITHLPARPHQEALHWLWKKWRK